MFKIAKIGLTIAACMLLLFWLPQPAWGAIAQSSRPLLTVEILQERLRSPIKSEGVRTIDLRRLIIDLRSPNAEFRDQFYPLLQTLLQRTATPIGLDLSYSVILGDFAGNDLGLRSPLYGQALSGLLTPAEQEVLQRDRRRLSQLGQLSRSLVGSQPQLPLELAVFRGPIKLVQTRFTGSVNFKNTFFLNNVDASGAQFDQQADWSETRFSQLANFASATFSRLASFRSSIYFHKSGFANVLFQEIAIFTGSIFEGTGSFNQVHFNQEANFTRSQWLGNADFSQSYFGGQALFIKNKFSKSLFLTGTTFSQLISFREARFSKPVNLRGASILNKADFSDAGFGDRAYLNVAGLTFDSDQAKISGDPGQIGLVLSVPALQGNETLLRNLVRNFRLQEQIPDANQVEYLTARLWRRQLGQRLLGVDINTASIALLVKRGFSQVQAIAIVESRDRQPFSNVSELLSLKEIDLATYVQVRDRFIANEALSPGADAVTLVSRILAGFQWLGLSLLLLLSCYGTNSWLVLGVGIVAIAYFGLIFWLVDRWRRRLPQPILPTPNESIWVVVVTTFLASVGTIAIFRCAGQPWFTLASLAIVLLPVPLGLLVTLYQRGRYHNLMDVSYFVEDGSMRQLRLMIGRLPVIPRYTAFRERYEPILWNRRWNSINYYDFSLNNLLKFGFNDIRLRDEHIPGAIAFLVWYQWSLGILYLTLLLWTLSRTIPGLNLLIYLK